MALLKENLQKELWNHFTTKEAKAIAACVYGTWLKLTGPIQNEKITQIKRPWTVFELFMLAVEKFQKVIDESPSGSNDFMIAHFDINTPGRITSGNTELDPREVAGAKEVFEALFGKGMKGSSWGDETKLQSYVDGIGGKLCRMYFGEVTYPRPVLVIEHRDIEGFEGSTRGKGSMNDIEEDEAPVPVKKLGRPPKVVAE